MAVDLVYMNSKIKYIQNSILEAENLMNKLSSQTSVSAEQQYKLQSLYDLIDSEIEKYYKYLTSVKVNHSESLLTHWLYEYNNIDKLDSLSHYLKSITMG
jgi:50S ribosomal subunit-associated GTPase HflX